MINRRTFLCGLTRGAIVKAQHAAAQPAAGKVPKLGFLVPGQPSARISLSNTAAFRQGLRDHGWIEGQNIIVDIRWTPTVARLPEIAQEFVRLRIDVIFAPTSTQVEAARQATKTIPIVFASHADPVGAGHVASLGRPGGNISGLAGLRTELSAKEAPVFTNQTIGFQDTAAALRE